MSNSAAVAPGYCPTCAYMTDRAVWTLTDDGLVWGPACPRDGSELRSTLLDLAGVPYYDPKEVNR